jgi:hypothetical protein
VMAEPHMGGRLAEAGGQTATAVALVAGALMGQEHAVVMAPAGTAAERVKAAGPVVAAARTAGAVDKLTSRAANAGSIVVCLSS